MIDYSWSQLMGTPIWQMAEAIYRSRPRLTYHNWTHIGHGYQHAKNTFGFAYDPNVDLAWLGHDIIYDELPDKELRSITRTVELYEQFGPIPGVDISVVSDMIATTIDHRSTRDDRVIMMDMADLADLEQAAINHELICTESMRLYGITREVFCQNSITFMTGLKARVHENGRNSTGLPFWSDVGRGIDHTIVLSQQGLERPHQRAVALADLTPDEREELASALEQALQDLDP